jgi:cysteine synthase
MNNEELVKENQLLKEELEKTKNILRETQEHLKRYTAPSNMKRYYETHKEEIKAKVKEYK